MPRRSTTLLFQTAERHIAACRVLGGHQWLAAGHHHCKEKQCCMMFLSATYFCVHHLRVLAENWTTKQASVMKLWLLQAGYSTTDGLLIDARA
jgi:hypothetical protein